MIRHVVALRLSGDDDDVRQNALDVARRLEALADVVPGILSIKVHLDLGLVAAHWPLVLIADFADAAALEAYQSHPRHREVLAWLNGGLVADRATVDFEVMGSA